MVGNGVSARARKRIECKCLNGENGNDKVARLLCYCKLVIAFNFSMFIFPAVFCVCVCVCFFFLYFRVEKKARTSTVILHVFAFARTKNAFNIVWLSKCRCIMWRKQLLAVIIAVTFLRLVGVFWVLLSSGCCYCCFHRFQCMCSDVNMLALAFCARKIICI